jgi:uncharacterized repeat protein (TIGR02543 family)
MTLFAQWTIKTYTVIFDSRDGSTVDSQTINHGGLVTKPKASMKTGYTFAGWYKELECTNPWDFATDTVTSDVTLFAKWTIKTYTVTFNENGGNTEAIPNTKTATHGGNVGTLPTEPTRTGYTFTSWNTKADSSGTEFTATTKVVADITVYAKWTANNYDITFDKNDIDATGDMVAQTIACGSSANLKACSFSKTGWTFAGWAETPTGAVTYTDQESYTMGTESITLYAKWTINTYTVTFDSHDGSTVDSQTVDYDGLVIEPARPTPAKEGYIFAHWYKEPEYINAWNFATDKVTADITLHVKWTCTTSYSIGDVGPAGGWIFYDNGYYDDVWKGQYLEAAPNNQDNKAWGERIDVPGADGIIIGTGQQNTSDIIAGDTSANKAADECANYSIVHDGVTYNDWFLPSKDELNHMYLNLHLKGVGGFPDTYAYWSSSEKSYKCAWNQKFSNGAQLSPYKYWISYVRAVRAF